MVVIASQSFEEETAQTAENLYTDPDTGGAIAGTVPLDNLPSAIVNSTGANTGLGYSASFSDPRSNGAGLTDGDTVGVVTAAGIIDSGSGASDGTNAYAIEDPDGLLTLTFDTVDISLFENVTVSVDVQIDATSYEASEGGEDSLSISVVTDLGTVELLTLDADGLDNATQGAWFTVTAMLPAGATTAQLVITGNTNSASEELFFDNVVIEGDEICFVSGTHIDTAQGPTPVEDLECGDLIRCDSGLRSLRWVGRRRIDPAPGQLPILIRAGSWLGNSRDIRVSPAHRMLIAGWRAEALFGVPQALVAARDLVNGQSILVDQSGQSVTYWHLLFDRHELVWAEGCLSESLHPAGVMNAAQRDELKALFPQLFSAPGTTAALALSAAEAAVL